MKLKKILGAALGPNRKTDREMREQAVRDGNEAMRQAMFTMWSRPFMLVTTPAELEKAIDQLTNIIVHAALRSDLKTPPEKAGQRTAIIVAARGLTVMSAVAGRLASGDADIRALLAEARRTEEDATRTEMEKAAAAILEEE